MNYEDELNISKDVNAKYNQQTYNDIILRHTKVITNSLNHEEIEKSLTLLNNIAKNENVVKLPNITEALIAISETKILESLSTNSSVSNNNLRNIFSVAKAHVKNKEMLKYIKCRLMTHNQQKKESLEWILETDPESLDLFQKSKFSNETIENFINFKSEKINNALYKNTFMSDSYLGILNKSLMISDETKKFREQNLANLYNFKNSKYPNLQNSNKQLTSPKEENKMFVDILKESLNQSLKISAAAVANEQICELAKGGLEKLGLPEELTNNKMLEAMIKSVIPIAMMAISSRNQDMDGEFSSEMMEKMSEYSQLALQNVSVETMDQVMSVVLPAVKSLVSSEEFKQLKEHQEPSLEVKELV